MAGTIPLLWSMTSRPIFSKPCAIMNRLVGQVRSGSLPKRWTGCVSGRKHCGWYCSNQSLFLVGTTIGPSSCTGQRSFLKRRLYSFKHNSPPMMFVMVKSGGIALLIHSPCGYTPLEKHMLQETVCSKEFLHD